WVAAVVVSVAASGVWACTSPASICEQKSEGSFALIQDGRPTTIIVEKTNDPAVQRVTKDFAADLKRVSGRKASINEDKRKIKTPVVVIGTVGHSQLIGDLIESGKLDV